MRRAVFSTPEAIEEAFYDSLRRGDVDGLMQLWAEDEESVCIHPSGSRLVGVETIRKSWVEIFRSGGLMIRPTAVHRYDSAAIAVHQVVEEIELQETSSMGTIGFALATNVYVAGPKGWKILIHHSSAVSGNEAPSENTAVLH